jgi:Domain of unknown function (DUF4157)
MKLISSPRPSKVRRDHPGSRRTAHSARCARRCRRARSAKRGHGGRAAACRAGNAGPRHGRWDDCGSEPVGRQRSGGTLLGGSAVAPVSRGLKAALPARRRANPAPDAERGESVAAAVRHGIEGPSMPLDATPGAGFAREFSDVRCSSPAAPAAARTELPERIAVGRANDPLEREADALAARTLAAIDAPRAPEHRDASAQSTSAFANVRVHADERAAESARALGARAYTIGSDIVFGGGTFAPQTPAGRRLLAHELAHVVQQRGAAPAGPAFIRRAPAPDAAFDDDPLSAGGFSDKDPSIRVKPGPVRTTFIRPRVAPMTTEDGTPFPGRQPDDGAWIQSFLTFFRLGNAPSLGSGEGYAFWGAKAPQRVLTMTEVVNTVIEQGALDGHQLSRSAVLAAVAVRLPAPRAPEPSTSRVSFYLTFSVVRTGHVDVKTGPVRPDSLGGQAAAQMTWEIHKENESGPEFSWVGQLAAFRDSTGPGESYRGPFQLQSAYTGVQAAWVFAFLKGSLQIGPIAQALRGLSRSQQADGIVRFVPTSQIGGGGQIVYVIPKTGEHLQIGGQAAAAFTAPAGAHATFDFAPSIFLQWKFGSAE